MKRKFMSVILSAVLVLGTASTAFGATKIERGSIDCKDVVNILQNYIVKYLEKYCGNLGNNNGQDGEGEQDNNGNQDSNENQGNNGNNNNNNGIQNPGGNGNQDNGSDNNNGNQNNGNNNNGNQNGGSQGGGQDDVEEDDDKDQEETPSVSMGEKQAQVVSLVNKERVEAGLGSLSTNSKLNALAQMKAEDMAKNKYFSHTSPTYGSAFDMLKQYGVSYKTAGENIAKGQKTAQSVMNGWMNSQGHRANILGSGYTQIGVGYALDNNGTPYWVQIFIG